MTFAVFDMLFHIQQSREVTVKTGQCLASDENWERAYEENSSTSALKVEM
jgi:hypothetical protein